jgi:LysM repeat protein
VDRKKIILSAICLNAGLLILLFISALQNGGELKEAPLFHHPVVFESTGEEASLLPPQESVATTQLEPEVVANRPIVHQLPPICTTPSRSAVIPSPAILPVSQLEITVQKGDTLEKIAKAYKTTIDELLRCNQLQSTFLRVGQMIKIPTQKSMTISPKENGKEGDYYVIKVGDTPWTVAQKYSIKVEELLKLNQLTSEKAKRLKPGDRLRIR